MKGHLFIHIGPPKTASTSLQISLEEVDLPLLEYLGTYQPRDEKSWVTKALHDYCVGRLEARDELLSRVHEIFADAIEAGRSVLISEEMFLVWQRDTPFWEKLDKLDTLLNGFPRTYLITARNPEDCLPSYYQELYSGIDIQQKFFPKLFFTHERCDCYDYSAITDWFFAREVNSRLIDFKKLTSPSFYLSDIIGPHASKDFLIKSVQSNFSKKRSGAERQLSNITIGDFSRIQSLQSTKETIRNNLPALFEYAKRISKSIELKPRGYRNLNIPKSRLSALTESYQAAMGDIQRQEMDNI